MHFACAAVYGDRLRHVCATTPSTCQSEVPCWLKRLDRLYFTSDRVTVRATLRVSFGFTYPLAVVKITKA